MKRLFPSVLALAVLMVQPLSAGSFSDLVMAPGVLDLPADGPIASYETARHLPEPSAAAAPVLPPIAQGTLTLTLAPDGTAGQVLLQRVEDGKPQPDLSFAAKGPNPALLFFLETLVKVMAAETGGSPFYIRNRIREALAAAEIAKGDGPQTLVLRPFDTDPNRGRMGLFADLAISIRFDPAAPGLLLDLRAEAGAGSAGYRETLHLTAKD